MIIIDAQNVEWHNLFGRVDAYVSKDGRLMIEGEYIFNPTTKNSDENDPWIEHSIPGIPNDCMTLIALSWCDVPSDYLDCQVRYINEDRENKLHPDNLEFIKPEPGNGMILPKATHSRTYFRELRTGDIDDSDYINLRKDMGMEWEPLINLLDNTAVVEMGGYRISCEKRLVEDYSPTFQEVISLGQLVVSYKKILLGTFSSMEGLTFWKTMLNQSNIDLLRDIANGRGVFKDIIKLYFKIDSIYYTLLPDDKVAVVDEPELLPTVITKVGEMGTMRYSSIIAASSELGIPRDKLCSALERGQEEIKGETRYRLSIR